MVQTTTLTIIGLHYLMYTSVLYLGTFFNGNSTTIISRGVRYGIIDFHLQKNNSNFGLLSGTKYW